MFRSSRVARTNESTVSLLAEVLDAAEVGDLAGGAARDGERRPVPGACARRVSGTNEITRGKRTRASALATVDIDALRTAVDGDGVLGPGEVNALCVVIGQGSVLG